MVSATTFLLIFILLLPLRFTTADTQLQGKNIPVVRGNLERQQVQRYIYHGVAESDQRTRFHPGRKMMSRGSKNGNNVAKGSSSNTKAKGEDHNTMKKKKGL
ncbi:hypothetical protein SESBI_33992 [Sesbania bispinosa]|nr:hypothetical protein SESBI_33992 [Sesbania bispinosa]